ncbi:MAG: hypothetical protein BRD50_05810 [Bacteroidetes bacterium SW_11_45_7]|nr:MAG: hypothetical protein BRD50_05810 [Bacteroidetes bacterium SW_11_45_7]
MTHKSYQVEFSIGSTASILFQFLITPTGLSQWFADDVKADSNHYFFTWDGYSEEAELVEEEEDKKVKFSWQDSDDTFFSFEIDKSEVTGDTILIITDFAEENEIEDQKLLWENQITTLKRVIGGA